MKVRDVYRPMPVTLGPEEPVRKAVAKMYYHRIGALPVMHGDWLVGIITERDLVPVLLDGVEAADALVGEYMTLRPTTVTPETDLFAAADLMRRLAARHLPVVEDDRVVGMLSARDLLANFPEPLQAVG